MEGFSGRRQFMELPQNFERGVNWDFKKKVLEKFEISRDFQNPGGKK